MAINSKIIFCKGIKMDKENMNVLTYSESDMLTLVNTTGIKIAEASNYSFIGKGDRDAIDVGLDLNLTYQVFCLLHHQLISLFLIIGCYILLLK